MNSTPHLPTDIQVKLGDLDLDLSDDTIRQYLAAKSWRENHIADRDTTYSDPTYRQALRNLGNWRPQKIA